MRRLTIWAVVLVILSGIGMGFAPVVGTGAAGVSKLKWPSNPCNLLSTAQVTSLLNGATPGAGVRSAAQRDIGRWGQCAWDNSNAQDGGAVVLAGDDGLATDRDGLFCGQGITEYKVTKIGSYALYCTANSSREFWVQDSDVQFEIATTSSNLGNTSESALEAAAKYVLKRLAH
jgi:hypothetical protein